MSNKVTDLRGRQWEMFSDLAYYDMWCVRCCEDKDFNSQLSFHFISKNDADKFLSLILESR